MALLESVFGKGPAEATQLMLHIHRTGSGVAGVYVLEVAETKVATVHRMAERRATRCAPEWRQNEPRSTASCSSRSRPPLREAMPRRHAYLTRRAPALRAAPRRRAATRCCATPARACGALKGELDAASWTSEVEKLPDGRSREHQQTLAFHRVIEARSRTRTSAEKDEVEAGDLLAAIFQEPDSHAVRCCAAQGVTRLDVLQYVSHGDRRSSARRARRGARGPAGERARRAARTSSRPIRSQAFATEPHRARAREGKLDPLIGREHELERTVHILARRRKNNPIFVGETRRRQDRARRGPRAAHRAGRRARRPARRRDLRARHRRAARRHALPRRLRGALQGADGGRARAAEAHPVHRRDPHDPRRGRRRRARPSTPRTC